MTEIRRYRVSVLVTLPDASDDPEDEFMNVARAVDYAASTLTARSEGAEDYENDIEVREVL